MNVLRPATIFANWRDYDEAVAPDRRRGDADLAQHPGDRPLVNDVDDLLGERLPDEVWLDFLPGGFTPNVHGHDPGSLAGNVVVRGHGRAVPIALVATDVPFRRASRASEERHKLSAFLRALDDDAEHTDNVR